uniref:Uncharacterized protein n=1 Tax=uncultured Armatimonadetes bacterium TaxID=157466 RepID=A0A6J4I3Y6_9BACT|nr:hypothetical protein AVDCRST_MAG63-1365 [uncultured Armatimonadetes bacterium]
MRRSEWRLTRGGEVLAVLRPDGRQLVTDYPCFEAEYETTDAFEPVRRLFEREAELLDVDSVPENDEWADIWEELQAPGLFVESPDGRERLDILWIHFKGGRAWWWPLYNSPQTRLG